MSRSFRKNRYRILLFWTAILCLLCGVFFSGVRDFLMSGRGGNAVIDLCGDLPDQEDAERILEQCRESEEVRDACFVCSEGVRTVVNQELARMTEVQVVNCTGMAALYDASGMALGENDREGCVIDRGTAEMLYGSPDCVGCWLSLDEKRYQVRGTADWNQRRILICSPENDSSCTQVIIRLHDCEIPENAAEEFLMQNGLSGICTEDGWLDTASAFVICFFPAVTVWGSGTAATLRMDGKRKKQYAGIAVKILALVTWTAVFWQIMEIPYSWIPDKWSDFGFWTERLLKEKEDLGWYLMSAKTPEQLEHLIYAVRSMGKCALAASASLAVWRRIWYCMRV